MTALQQDEYYNNIADVPGEDGTTEYSNKFICGFDIPLHKKDKQIFPTNFSCFLEER